MLSHLRNPLTVLLGSSGNVRLLRALASDPAPRSAPWLAAATGLTPQGARLALEPLVRERLVTAHGSDRTLLYALDAGHPLAADLATLFEREGARWDGLLASIRTVLDGEGADVGAAWLYGSVARGDDVPTSDLDIALLVRTADVADRVREALMPVEDTQRLRISVTGLTGAELAALPEDDPWWADVVRDGRSLKGPAPEQARRRLAKAAG